MKRILTFIGLKIAEIAGVVFIPWGLGIYTNKIFNYFGLSLPPVWISGLLVVGLGFLLFAFITANWGWAKHLTKKKEELTDE